MSEEARKSVMEGVKAICPVLVGVFPFAAITGATLVAIGMEAVNAGAMSVIVFAGAAQLAAAGLIEKGAPPAVTVLTALVINLRFMMYSASIAPHLKGLPVGWRALLAYVLSDQAYAVSIARFQPGDSDRFKAWFFGGAAVALWVTWQTGSVLGVLLGLRVPAEWQLDFAIPLTFLSILVPTLRSRGRIAAAGTAALISVLTFGFPLNTGLITAAAFGIAAGTISDRSRRQ